MTDIKINTEKELFEFLKVLAEESVNKTMTSIDENVEDPYTATYKQNFANDKNLGYNISEAEGEDDPFSGMFEDEPPALEEPDEEEPDEEEHVESEEQQETGEDFAVSFDSIVTAINTLRSGRSLKDKEVKSGVSKYYDRLSEPERMVLYTFLGALSKILTGAITGEEAQDPSDDPLSFIITTKDEEADEEAAADADTIAPTADAEEEEEEVEDTSPPIDVVAENQNKERLREKVRLLMSR